MGTPGPEGRAAPLSASTASHPLAAPSLTSFPGEKKNSNAPSLCLFK